MIVRSPRLDSAVNKARIARLRKARGNEGDVEGEGQKKPVISKKKKGSK